MITDLILKEGDIAVDDSGFIHGPLCKLGTGLGLFACEKSWDFHGMNMDGHHGRLVKLYEPPVSIPRAIRDGSMISIRFTREVAEAHSFALSDLACWLRGYRAGLSPEDRSDLFPYGANVLTDFNILIKHELRKTDQ